METSTDNFIYLDTLGQYAMDTIIDNYQRVFAKEIPIPSKISNGVFAAYQRRKGILDEDFLKIFSLPYVGKLTEIHLMRCSIEEKNVHYIPALLTKRIKEFSLHTEVIPEDFLDHLNKNAENLEVFSISGRLFKSLFNGAAYTRRPCILNAPNLKYFSVKWNCLEQDSYWSKKYYSTDFMLRLLTYFKKLEHLEIGGKPFLRVMTLDNTEFFEVMHSKITSLVFNDVILSDSNFKVIESLENLEHLDISNGGEYANPGQKLKSLIEKLANLKSLDISETNLDEPHVNSPTEIYGLQSRKNNPLEFLGLYHTHYDSCKWLNIPAIKISGYSNLEQLTNTARMYSGSMKIAKHWLNDFGKLHIGSENIVPAIELLLEYMAKMLDFGLGKGFIGEAMAVLDRMLTKPNLNFAIKWNSLKLLLNICTRSDCPQGSVNYYIWQILSRQLVSSRKLNCFIQPFINLILRHLRGTPPYYDFALHFSRISDEHQKRLFVDQSGMLELMESSRRIGKDTYQMIKFWKTIKNLINENSEITVLFLENGVSLFSDLLPNMLDMYDYAMTAAAKVFVQIIIQFKDLMFSFFATDQFLEILIKAFITDYRPIVLRGRHSPSELPNFYLGFILAQFLTMENFRKEFGKRNLKKAIKAFGVNFEDQKKLNHDKLFIGDELIDPMIDLIQRKDIPECKYLAIWGFFNIIKHCRTRERRNHILKNREVLKLSLEDFVPKYVAKYPIIADFAETLRRDPLICGD